MIPFATIRHSSGSTDSKWDSISTLLRFNSVQDNLRMKRNLNNYICFRFNNSARNYKDQLSNGIKIEMEIVKRLKRHGEWEIKLFNFFKQK